jgi:transposase InsO family protein
MPNPLHGPLERLYNRKRSHRYQGNLSPAEYENRTMGT